MKELENYNHLINVQAAREQGWTHVVKVGDDYHLYCINSGITDVCPAFQRSQIKRVPKSQSSLEAAYCAALNCRDYASDRYEAMKYSEQCLGLLRECGPYQFTPPVIEILAEAKEKWGI